MIEQPIFAPLLSTPGAESIGDFSARFGHVDERSQNAEQQSELQAQERRKRRDVLMSNAYSLTLLQKAENSSGHDKQHDGKIVHTSVIKLVDSLPKSWIPEPEEYCCPLFPFCIRKWEEWAAVRFWLWNPALW